MPPLSKAKGDFLNQATGLIKLTYRTAARVKHLQNLNISGAPKAPDRCYNGGAQIR